MSCPTCSHTMATILAAAPDGYPCIRHCERCGTMTVLRAKDYSDVYVPKLVGRCRGLYASTSEGAWTRLNRNILRKIGIAESIHLPENRT